MILSLPLKSEVNLVNNNLELLLCIKTKIIIKTYPGTNQLDMVLTHFSYSYNYAALKTKVFIFCHFLVGWFPPFN
jgi:hypothetical protein